MGDTLPLEVLEEVLTFLPISSLCRFKTTCKAWNKLISCRYFASKHGQVSFPEEYVLVTIRQDYFLDRKGWEVLDIANKRYITLNDDFLTNYVKKTLVGNNALRNKNLVRSTVAADGGLFCMRFGTEVPRDGSVLVVCNPVLKLVKQLPCPSELPYFPRAMMLTDRLTMDYEIFVVRDCYDNQDGILRQRLYIYESKTARWRAPSVFTPEHRHTMHFEPLPVIFLNKLFLLCKVIDNDTGSLEIGYLVSYDKLTDEWCEVGIELPSKLQDVPWLDANDRSSFGRGDIHLAVSGDHLFYITTDIKSSSVKIFEISLARKECTLVAESHCLHWMLPEAYRWRDQSFCDICVVSCADWILTCSQWTGQCVAYNLSSKSWHQFPDHKGEKSIFAHVLHLTCGGQSLGLCFP